MQGRRADHLVGWFGGHSAAAASRLARRVDLGQAMTLAFTIAFTLAFYAYKDGYETLIKADARWAFVFASALSALALAFVPIRYSEFPRLFSILTRATVLGILVYLIAEPPDYTLANANAAHLAHYSEWGYWLGIAAGVGGIFRPSLVLPAAFYCISARFFAADISGIGISKVDIVFMMEMGQYLSFAAIALALLRYVRRRSQTRASPGIAQRIEHDRLANCLAFVAIGFHLGNYFWSGYQKAVVGPYPWTWFLENATQNTLLFGIEKGTLTFATQPQVTQRVFEIFSLVVVPLNLFVICSQLFAVLAPLRRRWLLAASFAYDALHIGIYVAGGLLFWPWIWNNGSVIAATRTYRDEEIGWLPRICCLLAILAGGSQALGGSARLAWFDVADIKITSIQVEGPAHRWVDVPNDFFLSHSYAMSQGGIDMAAMEGHYAPTFWGSSSDYQRARTSGQCVTPPPVARIETEEARAARLQRLTRYITAHHERMLKLAARYGKYFHYFRLHHHPVNPRLFPAFNGLDLNAIQRYRILTRSVCLSLSDGKLKEREVKRDTFTFDVR